MRRPLLGLAVCSVFACGGGPEPAAPSEPRVRSRPAPKAVMAKPTGPSKPNAELDEALPPVEPAATKCDVLGYCNRQTPTRKDASFDDIVGIWGTSPDNVYFVGARGFMLRYDGKSLIHLPAKVFRGADLSDIWGTGPSDLYVPVAGRGVAHFDGNGWIDLAGPRAGRIGGGSANAPWVAEYGSVQRRSGDEWTTKNISATSFFDAWQSGPNDAYAVGEIGLIYHYDGAAWTRVTTGLDKRPPETFRSVWGSGPNDVFVGGQGQTLHYDGKAWAALPMPRGTDDVIAIRGLGPNDVYALGSKGWLSHYDGGAWTLLTDVGLGATRKLARLWIASADDLWFGGKAMPLVRLERTFTRETSGTEKDLYGVHGADGEAFAVGDAGVALHHVGGAWKAEPTGTKKALRDVWMGSRTEAWAVGEGGTILKWDGRTWKAQTSPTKEDLLGVSAGGGKAVAVGKRGTVVTFDGTKWSLEQNRTNANLTAVAMGATGGDDFVAAGEGGVAIRGVRTTSGRDITAETVKDAGDLRAAWVEPAKGANPPISVVCDNKGTAFRFALQRWEKGINPSGLDVRGATRIGRTTWAAGARGLVHASTERTELPWLSDVAPAKMDLHDVWGPDEKEVVVVGKGGAIARRKRK